MAIPFQLLHTFVVVVRAKRMGRAADLLGVTAGAISQRLKELEDLLQRRLLLRSRSGLELTRTGEKLFCAIAGPFEKIEDAYDASANKGSSQRIVISTTPSFASTWLVPRLGSFTARYPKIEVVIETDARVINLHTDPVDLAIRHGLGQYEGLESHWLISPRLMIVASPALLNKGPAIKALRDCLSYPFLHDVERKDWPLLFAGLKVKCKAPLTGPAFSGDHLLIKAAIAGQGLALVADTYANAEIAAGRLVNPIKIRWPTKFAYYLVGRPKTFRRPAVRQFKEWALSEAAAT